MSIAACYSMDLYCRHYEHARSVHYDDKELDQQGHHFAEFPHEFTGETFGECAKQAKQRGWIFHRDGDVSCPKCAKKKIR